jgi:hypothetical protein
MAHHPNRPRSNRNRQQKGQAQDKSSKDAKLENLQDAPVVGRQEQEYAELAANSIFKWDPVRQGFFWTDQCGYEIKAPLQLS